MHSLFTPLQMGPKAGQNLMDSARRRSVVYVLVVFALSTVVYYLILTRHAFNILVILLGMWCPAIAAVLASWITRRPLRDIGWRLGKAKWLGLGYVFPLLYAAPAYLLVWSTGLGGFPNPEMLGQMRVSLHLSARWSSTSVIFITFLLIATQNVLLDFLLTTGEEIGWRGFLVPELTNWVGFHRAALLSGVIWGLWHVPLIVAGPYSQSGTPRWYQVTCFVFTIVPEAVAFAWLRMRSGSIWPSVVFHSAHNAFVQAFFDPMTINTGNTHYFTGECGAAMLPFAVLLAFYCWSRMPTNAGSKPFTASTGQ